MARRLIPNLLTFLRVVLVPVIVVLLARARSGATAPLTWALVAFATAGISDWLDGTLARRWQVVSRFGKLVDPLADKLVMMSVFVMAIPLGWLQAWLVVVLLARETAVNTLRMLALGEGHVLAAGRGGKLKTVLQFLGVSLLLGAHLLPALPLRAVGYWLVVVSAVVAWASGIEYAVAYFRVPTAPAEGGAE